MKVKFDASNLKDIDIFSENMRGALKNCFRFLKVVGDESIEDLAKIINRHFPGEERIRILKEDNVLTMFFSNDIEMAYLEFTSRKINIWIEEQRKQGVNITLGFIG